jgi:hypothetical protein
VAPPKNWEHLSEEEKSAWAQAVIDRVRPKDDPQPRNETDASSAGRSLDYLAEDRMDG